MPEHRLAVRAVQVLAVEESRRRLPQVLAEQRSALTELQGPQILHVEVQEALSRILSSASKAASRGQATAIWWRFVARCGPAAPQLSVPISLGLDLNSILIPWKRCGASASTSIACVACGGRRTARGSTESTGAPPAGGMTFP